MLPGRKRSKDTSSRRTCGDRRMGVLMTPRQFGPRMANPVSRQTAISSSCRAAPSASPSMNPPAQTMPALISPRPRRYGAGNRARRNGEDREIWQRGEFGQARGSPAGLPPSLAAGRSDRPRKGIRDSGKNLTAAPPTLPGWSTRRSPPLNVGEGRWYTSAKSFAGARRSEASMPTLAVTFHQPYSLRQLCCLF